MRSEENVAHTPHRVAEHPGALPCERTEGMGLTVGRVAEGPRLDGDPPARNRSRAKRRGYGNGPRIPRVFGQSSEIRMSSRKTHGLSKGLIEDGRSIRTRVRGRSGNRAAL